MHIDSNFLVIFRDFINSLKIKLSMFKNCEIFFKNLFKFHILLNSMIMKYDLFLNNTKMEF